MALATVLQDAISSSYAKRKRNYTETIQCGDFRCDVKGADGGGELAAQPLNLVPPECDPTDSGRSAAVFLHHVIELLHAVVAIAEKACNLAFQGR
jgi:hypothetical protein